MSTKTQIDSSLLGALRVGLGFAGLVTLLVGLLILLWPDRTAVVGTALLASYMVLEGIVYAAIGVFSKVKTGWSRVGHLVLAVLFLVGGISAFANLRATAAFLAVFLAVSIGILWIFEGFVSLATLGSAASKGMALFFAVLSIVAGVVIILSPIWSAVLLWWLVGVSLLALGAIQIGRALTLKKSVEALPAA